MIKLSSVTMAFFAPPAQVLGERAYGMPSWMSPENPNNQIQFILSNSIQYLAVLMRTLFEYYGYNYFVAFIGNFGWMDAPLPTFLVFTSYIILFFAAFASPSNEFRTGWKLRVIPLAAFLGAVLIIFTVNYVVASPYKGFVVEGVQGRYFIPYAPLLLLIFYNVYVNNKLNLAFSFRRNEIQKSKARERTRVISEIQENEQVFSKSFHLFLVIFAAFSLILSVYVLAHRYYHVGESEISFEARENAEKAAITKIRMMQENSKMEARYIELANAASMAKKFDSTTYYLEKVIALDPGHKQAAENLAVLYFQLKKKDKAINVIERMKANGLEVSKDLENLAK